MILLTKVLMIRKKLAKSSVSKYTMMDGAMGADLRLKNVAILWCQPYHGRWAGRLIQVQNLPRNYIENLDTARHLVKTKNRQRLELLYGDVGYIYSN